MRTDSSCNDYCTIQKTKSNWSCTLSFVPDYLLCATFKVFLWKSRAFGGEWTPIDELTPRTTIMTKMATNVDLKSGLWSCYSTEPTQNVKMLMTSATFESQISICQVRNEAGLTAPEDAWIFEWRLRVCGRLEKSPGHCTPHRPDEIPGSRRNKEESY